MFKWIKNIDAGDVIFYVSTLLLAFAVFIAIITPAVDRRDFKEITEQCEKMGYIQDNVTRIKCSIEK